MAKYQSGDIIYQGKENTQSRVELRIVRVNEKAYITEVLVPTGYIGDSFNGLCPKVNGYSPSINFTDRDYELKQAATPEGEDWI